jgi:hypothetical protein
MAETIERTRPSSTGQFADVVTFFLAIRAGDRARVIAMLQRSPDLVDAVQEWDRGLVIDGVLPFASRATALITAIERDDLALLTLLLDAGADVNGECRCATGESPVWAATVLNRSRHLRTLLERGGDPNRVSGSGNMPLHVAAMRGLVPAAQLLLAHGADRNARDARNRTPADWARVNGHQQLAQLLAGAVAGDPASAAEATSSRRAMAGSKVWLTGIKALDLFCPIPRGGLVRIPFMAGVGMVVLLGELCRRMTLSPSGRALWSGFSQRPFDVKDLQTEMSELGLLESVQHSVADLDAGTEARRDAFRQGLDQAEALCGSGLDVLLVLGNDPEFESDLEACFARLAAPPGHGSITTLLMTTFPEAEAATWPQLRPPFDAQVKLNRPRARRGLYPSVDPGHSLSRLLCERELDSDHVRIAGLARERLLCYAARDPEFAAFEPVGAAADPHFAGAAAGAARSRGDEDEVAQQLIRYLTQPFFVTEPFSGRPGEWVDRSELLDTVRAILRA